MKKILLLIFCLCVFGGSFAQSWKNNGQLDNFQEFATKYTVPLVMPDGIKLFTDFYVPRLRDSLGFNILGYPIEVIPRGAQIIFYDSLNGQPNPNPYQLPTIFTRTPYDKGAETDSTYYELGPVMAMLGYNYMYQDMRGRYTSGGIYFPMYSDSWNKNGYHPNYSHVLDPYPLTDPRNSNRHEDGYHSIKAIAQIDSAYIVQHGDAATKAAFANYYQGLPHTNTRLNNGSIGMFGASALGNTQLQLATAHRVLDSIPQLKCLLPIVATVEHYLSTGYNGGVFRNRIVTGWLKGQIFSGTNDDLNAIDVATGAGYRDNSIHSSADYDLPKPYTVNRRQRMAQQNKFEAANISIDHFSTIRYPVYGFSDSLGPAGFYPNSVGRKDMDASYAFVDKDGESVDGVTQLPRPNLTYSRYTNLQVPVLHFTGWWDIFTDGQISTLKFTQQHVMDSFKRLQKIIIGPYAHQTVGSRTTGDRTYPENVNEITKVDLGNIDLDAVPIDKLVTSDLLTWFRSNLNFNTDKVVGQPKFIIKAGTRWQNFAFGKQIRIPATDYIVPFAKMLNFLAGKDSISNITFAQRDNEQDTTEDIVSIPLPIKIENGLPFSSKIPPEGIPYKDYHNVPTFRLYIPGPDAAADSAAGVMGNDRVGNYWYESEEFPPCKNIRSTTFYFHQNGSFNTLKPSVDEGYRSYIHDPNDPILTVGGNNMIVRSPLGDRNSQGQMEWTDPNNAPYTMNRPGVLKFVSDAIQDSMTILGFPKIKLWAKTNPAGAADGDPTDTDWNVRIGDMFPDGRIYFVQEGACNARARDYVRAIQDLDESEADRNIPYSNVESGKTYEYDFNAMAIGYTWGKGHKIVVLVSSSNFTRYQVNPNLPLEDLEFFRRNPGDGQTYTFKGREMSPRVAINRLHFSPEHLTSITFPVVDNTLGGSCALYQGVADPIKTELTLSLTLFPNPAGNQLQIFVSRPSQYSATIYNQMGQVLEAHNFDDNLLLNLSQYASGMYLAEVTDLRTKEKVTQKFVKE